MKKDVFKLSLIIAAVAAALLDIAYIVFLAVQISGVRSGAMTLSLSFNKFSVGVIVVNAALAVYTAVYLIFRKR